MLAIKLTTNNTMKRKNNTLAIDVALAAIPPKPKRAAINANTRKVSAQLSMIDSNIRDLIPTPEIQDFHTQSIFQQMLCLIQSDRRR
jgi:hypothetical protein